MADWGIVFKVHFFLYEKARDNPVLKYDLQTIDKECKINNPTLTLNGCDFLEYEKRLIRNWKPEENPATGYQEIASGSAVMGTVWPRIIEKLRSYDNPLINDILTGAGHPGSRNFYGNIYEKGGEYGDELPIMKTIIEEYRGYVEPLEVFRIELSPDTFSVGNSNKAVTVSGTISEPYHKLHGNILIRIFRHGGRDADKKQQNVKFSKGSISGAINFSAGYPDGNHYLIGYFQLEGERLPDRYDAYANSGKVPFKIVL